MAMKQPADPCWHDVVVQMLRKHYDIQEPMELERLSGGASRSTWRVPGDGNRPTLFLQTQRPGGTPGQSGQRAEASAMRTARDAGLPAPRIVTTSHDSDVSDTLEDFVLVEGLLGEAQPDVLLSDPGFATARANFAHEIGTTLAHLHAIDPGRAPELPTVDPLVFYADLLAELGEPHPALELGLSWLRRNRPPTAGTAIVHGDFRLGNLLFDGNRLTGVLDWELVHLGDPAEDLGWLCEKSWRFGRPYRAGGIADVQDVLTAYHAAGGSLAVTEESIHWWEVLATVKWGVICIMQSEAHRSGAERSVELAALGRRTASVERDLLDLLGIEDGAGAGPATPSEQELTGPHDQPTVSEILETVTEFLRSDVRPAVDDRTAYLSRVAARLLTVVERDTRLGPVLAERHRTRLAAHRFNNDAELCSHIRNDDVTDRAALEATVAHAVHDKLLVSDPRRLTTEHEGDTN